MMNEDYYPFPLKPLPYGYDALEPYIDTRTVEIHHDKHQKAYVDNLNHLLSGYPAYQSWSLEELLENLDAVPVDIRQGIINNGGGVYNHQFYWDSMQPAMAAELGNNVPTGYLNEEILNYFGSFERFQEVFTDTALSTFGSGWVWLVIDDCGWLQIISTTNQNSPISMGLCPILNLDVWEHAYYLKYQNLRVDYVKNWWNLVNWDEAEENYLECIGKRVV